MSSTLYLNIGGAVIDNTYVKDVRPKPTGPRLQGACPINIMKPGGGLATILPMARVQVGRKVSGSFSERQFQGVVIHRKTVQVVGSNILLYDLKCADLNIIGRRTVTPTSFVLNVPAGHYNTQVASVVAAVQGAYGGTWEGIDATSFVGDLWPTMPAFHLEGGHRLDWYLDQLDKMVIQLSSGAIQPKHYYTSDPTAGPADFGGVILVYYDDNSPGAVIDILTDTNGKIRRRWERDVAAEGYYYRRQGTWGGGNTVTGLGPNNFVNPWCAGGWAEEAIALQVNDAASAQALIDEDVRTLGALVQTFRMSVAGLPLPGDTNKLTLTLDAISNQLVRVAEANQVYLGNRTEKPETNIVLGSAPRRLGDPNSPGSGGISFGDGVPPVPPAVQPGVVRNYYDPATGKAMATISSITSVSWDTSAIRIAWDYVGSAPIYGPWVPCQANETITFEPFKVPRGGTVHVYAQCRDTSMLIGAFGPTRTFVGAGGVPNTDFRYDSYSLQDPTLDPAVDQFGSDDFTSVFTGTGIVTQDTSIVFEGLVSAKFAVGAVAADGATLTSTPRTCTFGTPVGMHIYEGSATNTHGTLTAQLLWLASDYSTIGSPENIYVGPPSTVVDGVEHPYFALPPIGATMFVIFIEFVGDGTPNHVYVGPPVRLRAISIYDEYVPTTDTTPRVLVRTDTGNDALLGYWSVGSGKLVLRVPAGINGIVIADAGGGAYETDAGTGRTDITAPGDLYINGVLYTPGGGGGAPPTFLQVSKWE